MHRSLARLFVTCTLIVCHSGAHAQPIWFGQTSSTDSLTGGELYDEACALANAAGFNDACNTCLLNNLPVGNGDTPPPFYTSQRAVLCKRSGDPYCPLEDGDAPRCGFSAYNVDQCAAGKYDDTSGTCVGPEKEQGGNICPSSSNPIYFASGNKYLSETDYQGVGVMPLTWARAYNGLDKTWRFSYMHELERVNDEEKILWRSDGHGIRFRDPGQLGSWSPDADVSVTLTYDAGNDEWIATHEDDSVEVFDSAGKLLSITNRNGQAITLSYSSGQLSTISHFSGRTLTLTYDTYGRVESMSDPDSQIYRYEYDLNGMLEYVFFPDDTPGEPNDNPRVQYHYEHTDTSLVTGMTDELGVRYATYDYDTYGRATLSERAGSVESTSVVYNSDGTVSVTNELGKQTDYTFAVTQLVRKVTQIDGQATTLCGASVASQTYDANGFLDLRTDEEGNVTDYDYNTLGLVTSKTEGFGTPEAVTTTTQWHSTFRVPETITKPGQTIGMTYDANGRLLTRTVTDTQTQTVPYVTTGDTRTTTYTYNTLGLVETIDGPRTDVSDVTTYAYDANGDLLTITNPLGHVVEIISRDASGRVTAFDDANDLRTVLAYDVRGRLTTRTVQSSQGDVVTGFVYNDASLLTQVNLPSGGFIKYEYDDAHRLEAISNELEERIEYQLDGAGNPTKIDYRGPGGELVATQDQLFDELSRLREITDGASNTTSFDVDFNGNVTGETDALSRATAQAYDALDRLETITDADTNNVSMTYDDRGNLLTVTDQRGIVTTYVYDGLDNLIQESSNDAGTVVYYYDAAGNLTQQVDARSIVSDYTYDALNRLTGISYPAHATENVTYQYDIGANALGRLNQITDESGSTSYLYDDRGNVTQDQRIIDGTTYTTQYQYDLSDQITKTTYPSGREVDAIRDSQSRIERLTQTYNSVTQDLIAASQFDGRGMREAVEYGNGLYRTWGYDLAGRLETLTLTDTHNGAPVAYSDSVTTHIGVAITIDVLANDKDLNGDVLSIFDLGVPGTGSAVLNGDQTITYTPAGSGSYSTSFTYQATDGAGPSNVTTVYVSVEDPGFVDSDGDGLSDALETAMGLDPHDASDTVADADGDGVDNYAEYLAGTDPLVNPAGLAAAIDSHTPFAHWYMDETSGTTLTDSTANAWVLNAQNSHALNATSVQETGSAVDVTGGSLYAVYPGSSWNMSGDYTVEGMLRWTSSNYAYLHSRWRYLNGSVTGTFITTHSGGHLRFYEHSSAYLYSDTADMNDGQWRHVAFVRRGDQLEIWINGELDASTTATQPDMSAVYGHLELMGARYNIYRRVEGTIDNWAVHKSALSPSEIKAHVMSMGDKDLDQLPTGWELANSHDPLDANDATHDYDGDGSTAYDEYTFGTDPMRHPNGYLDSILADNPAGYWPLDDTGTTATDVSGNGHHGTYSGTYTQSQGAPIAQGDAVQFVSGKVEIPHHASLNPNGDFSFELWMRWSTTVKGTGLKKADSGDLGYWIRPNRNNSGTQAGRVLITTDPYDDTHEVSPSTLTGLNDDVWRHYAGVRRGNQLELWVDGVLIESKTVPLTPDLSSMTANMFLGQFDGYVDEVAVYDHALLPGDIRQRLIQGKTPPPVVKVEPEQLQNQLNRWLAPGDQIAVRDLRLRTVETQWFTLDNELNPVAKEATQTTTFEDVAAVVLHEKARTHVYFRQSDGTFKFESLGDARQTGVLAAASSGLNEVWTYNYDAVSNIDDLTKPSGIEDFGYDNLDRLDDYTLPGQSQVTYSYDAVGNRLTESQSGVTQTHTYGTTNNRLTHQSGIQISYDGAGNPLNNGLGTLTYTYNAANRQTTVTENSQVVATYTYNALGHRTNKVTTTEDIDFVYDLDGKLLGEYANGVVIREYVYADGQLLAQGDATTVTYLHADHLGTPRMATDTNGTIVWRWDSDPFGETAPNEDPDGDLNDITVPLRFPGQYADIETGQYYNYFRTYDASIGRYTQPDPIGLNGGINGYNYVDGNPQTYSDPFGLRKNRACVAALTAVGAACGGSVGYIGGGLVGAGGGTLVAPGVGTISGGIGGSKAGGALGAMLGGTLGNVASDAFCPEEEDCVILEERVRFWAADVRRRYFELLEDQHGLYNGHRDPRNRKGRKGSYAGHQQQLRDKIKTLEKAIEAADAAGCFVDPQDRALLGLVIPARPAN